MAIGGSTYIWHADYGQRRWESRRWLAVAPEVPSAIGDGRYKLRLESVVAGEYMDWPA